MNVVFKDQAFMCGNVYQLKINPECGRNETSCTKNFKEEETDEARR